MSISPAVRRAQDFGDLLSLPGGDGPYVFTSIFRESERRDRQLSRRKFKLLKKIDGEIREVVGKDEHVFFLALAQGFTFWEHWILGWRRAVVLTERRVLVLQVDSRTRPRVQRLQIRYRSVVHLEAEKPSRLGIRLTSNEWVELRGLAREDRDTLRERILSRSKEEVGASSEGLVGEGPREGGLDPLCPACHRALLPKPRSCPHCLRKFRRPWVAAALSFLLPGLGNLRLGNRTLAIVEAIGAATAWLTYLMAPFVWDVPQLRSLIGPVWILLGVHGTIAVWTHLVARHGVYSAP